MQLLPFRRIVLLSIHTSGAAVRTIVMGKFHVFVAFHSLQKTKTPIPCCCQLMRKFIRQKTSETITFIYVHRKINATSFLRIAVKLVSGVYS